MTITEQLRQEGFQRGMQQGIQQGIHKGIQQEKLFLASKLLKEGMSIAKIIELTGISQEKL